MIASNLRFEDHHISVNKTDTLFLKRIYESPNGPAVLMIHGAIENGKIFYSQSGKGLAPFLAAQGFDVFIADLRGHGLSTPPIDKDALYGQFEHIAEDIPAFLDRITAIKKTEKISLLAHSWGGVLLTSFLGRFPERIKTINSLVYFGSKRRVQVLTSCRFFKVSVVWNRLGFYLTRKYGYLPAKAFKIGSDNETAQYHADSVKWVRSDRWIDPRDGFDYHASLTKNQLPPIWYLAAIKDGCLGHPKDVERMINESGEHQFRFSVLSKANGNQQNYDHISMLTHPASVSDHFPKVTEWLRRFEA